MATAILGYKTKGGGSTIVKGPLPETGKKGFYYFVPVSEGGDTKYNVYQWIDDKFVLISYQDSLDVNKVAYGVEWNINNSSPLLTRIGNLEYHKTLPIQSQLRGCICQGSKIMYYLDANDWSKKEDGEASRLDGYDGTVRVEIPKFYLWSEVEGDIRRVYISQKKLYEFCMEIPNMVIDAYRSTVLRQVPTDMGYLSTLPVNSPVSIVNTKSYCRGGNNSASYDQYLDTDQFRSLLGKPATQMSRATFRQYAFNSGTIPLCYEYYKAVFYWLWVIEYANFNSQDNYNEDLTTEGYRQGGMSIGISNMTTWNEYNGANPIVPCGYHNDIGNNTGIKTISSLNYDYQTIAINTIKGYTRQTNSSYMVSSYNGDILNITYIGSTTQNLLYLSWSSCTGTVTYSIEGLQEGQSLVFMRGNTPVLTVDTDGEYTITWKNNKQQTNIRSTFTGDCNINISIVKATADIISINRPAMTSFRWRGFDNTFGDIWTNVDGVMIFSNTSDNYNSVYTTTNPDNFKDTKDYISDMNLVGQATRANGYIKTFDLGNQANIIPYSVGGNVNMYKCDNYWSWKNSTQSSCLLLVGDATSGSYDGLAYFHSYYSVGTAASGVSFRTLNLK